MRKLRSTFGHRVRDLLSDEGTAAAAAVVAKHRAEWNDSLPSVVGDRDKAARLKRKLREATDQSLQRDVPNFDKIVALRREFSKEFRAVVDANPPRTAGALTVHPAAWADGLDSFGMKSFDAPFDATEILSFPLDWGIESNRSRAFNDVGLVLNDITWRDDNRFLTTFDEDRWGGNDVSVGVNFEAPQSGFLNVAVNMQNLYNRVRVGGSDNFGFSSATIEISHDAFILLLRDGHRFMTFHKAVTDGWVEPGGDDFHYTFPDFPQGSAVFAAQFDDTLHAQEQVQILAGCQTYVRGYVDNMDCVATVKMLWQINRIYVWLA